ncbi:MAG: PH domain-containing protein [Patescibacteria group bacterium]
MLTDIIQILMQLSVFVTGAFLVVLIYHFIKFGPNKAFRLREQEEVITIRRRHWFTLFSSFLRLGFLAFFFVAALLFIYDANYSLVFAHMNTTLIWLLAIIFAEAILVISLTVFADYYLDLWVVTNQRSIRIELRGLFSRNTISINHDRVQEISVEVVGVIPTILGYGKVHVQTAGAEADFVFENIPFPYEMKDIIYKMAKKKPE